jgi:hypothetical protein
LTHLNVIKFLIRYEVCNDSDNTLSRFRFSKVFFNLDSEFAF